VPTKLQDMQRLLPVVPPQVTDTVQTADLASLVITLVQRADCTDAASTKDIVKREAPHYC